MSQTTRFHGISVNWGVASTIIGVNGLFQLRDHDYVADNREIKDGGETVVSKAYWNPHMLATFTYVAIQNNFTRFGNAQITIPQLGSFIQVVDPNYSFIAGYWLVDGISLSTSNTSATRVTLKLSSYPNVQTIGQLNQILTSL